MWDHPREYGENPGPKQIVGERTRIIPANTGKITWHNRDRCWVRDHPREYGENASALSWSYVVAGSSPRIRGKYQLCRVHDYLRGIIPANTGKMVPQTLKCPPIRDHPREYGENTLHPACRLSRLGSSPRIRGKFFRHGRSDFQRRIIPANTGKILATGILVAHVRDHPREYGENYDCGLLVWVRAGSSPRIRGKCGGRFPIEVI